MILNPRVNGVPANSYCLRCGGTLDPSHYCPASTYGNLPVTGTWPRWCECVALCRACYAGTDQEEHRAYAALKYAVDVFDVVIPWS